MLKTVETSRIVVHTKLYLKLNSIFAPKIQNKNLNLDPNGHQNFQSGGAGVARISKVAGVQLYCTVVTVSFPSKIPTYLAFLTVTGHE